MKAIILAAGNGVRMRPLTAVLPKPLLAVGKRTLLDHLVTAFPPSIDQLVMVVRHLGDKVKNFCGEKFHDRPVTYVDQPENVHGTFAALKACERLLKSGEQFFVFYADDLIARRAISDCLKHRYAIVASAVAEPRRFGVIERNGDGTLKGIAEKPDRPATNLVLTNTLLLDTAIFGYQPPVNANGEQYLTHALCDLAGEAPVRVVETDRWFPVGYPEDLKKAEAFLRTPNSQISKINQTVNPQRLK